jgi:hypothetical protein
MAFYTLYRNSHPHGGPLPDGIEQKVKITSVALASKIGSEAHLLSEKMVDPDVECWFVLKVEYDTTAPIPKSYVKNYNKRDHDEDYIATNGEMYYVARRSIGLPRLVISDDVHRQIMTAIQKYVGTLI